jgi:hypothetical protein
MRYAKGIMWLADCRIPFVDEGDTTINHNTQPGSFVGSFGSSETIYKENTQGRFTPNLLVCDDMLNDGSVSEAKANLNYKWNNTDGGGDIFSNRGTYTPRNDKGSSSRYYDLDKWFDKIIKEL